jgi:hypothetical protein
MNRKAFLTAYLECALWSSIDYDNGDDTFGRNYVLSEFSPNALKTAENDCNSFIDLNQPDLGVCLERDSAQLGHDFWLTRNGHGAGFWDGRINDKEVAARITKSAHSFGEVHLYINQDLGQIDIE